MIQVFLPQNEIVVIISPFPYDGFRFLLDWGCLTGINLKMQTCKHKKDMSRKDFKKSVMFEDIFVLLSQFLLCKVVLIRL